MIKFNDFHRPQADPDIRRSHRRLLCSDLITLHWKTDRGVPLQEVAVLEDYSANGAGLYVTSKIEPGAEITIRTAWESFGASVRRCIWRDDSYWLGVEFHVPRPEGGTFEPDHLLIPHDLGL